MPLDLTRINRGAAPDDEDADSAYEAAGTLNDNMAADEEVIAEIEAAIAALEAVADDLGTAANADSSDFAAASHTHAIANVTGLQTALDGKSATGHGHAISDTTGLQSALDAKADLVGGVLPTAQLPAIAVTEYLGEADDQTEMLALSGQKGDWCIRTDTGTVFVIKGADPTQLSNWQELEYPAAPVSSVNSQSGAVTLGYADVGAASAAQGATADAAVPKALYDAHSILAATSDNTPAALTVAEETLVGRITGGNLAALTASQVRALLGLVIGTNVQAQDAELAAIAGLASAADKVPYFTGSGAAALADFPAAARALLAAVSTGVGLPWEMEIALSDETTAITTGDAKVTFRMPCAVTLNAGNAGARLSCAMASSSGLPTVDINESGSTILSTKLTLDANERTSLTAATPVVISDTALADDAEITVDIDVAGTGCKGLKLLLRGTRTS